MKLENCNPYIRAAEIQPAILEGRGPRKAYDHRLFYVLEGTGTVMIAGEAHSLGPDSLIILPPAVEYYFIGKLRTAVMNFDLTRRFCHRTEPICPPGVDEFDQRLLFDTEVADGFDTPCLARGDLYIRDAVQRIVEEHGTAGHCADALTSALLKVLLAELLHRDDDKENTLCKKILMHIRTHAASITGNEQIAQVFGYHPVYLGELFRRVTGRTLHSAIMEERITLSCRWLIRTDSSVSDIAEACGFCSRTHFCTVFKKKMGQTPTDYRNSR